MSPPELVVERGSVEFSDRTVSTLLVRPADSKALVMLGHGAGTDMEHGFMEGLACGLAETGIATLRYNFPFRERGSGPPDRAPVLVTAIEAVSTRAVDLAEKLPVFLGGKSMGGRMASHAVVEGRVPSEIRGLIYIGFPLHRPREPGIERAAHLPDIQLPMLFVQGTRDRMATPELMEDVVHGIGSRARLVRVEDADHGFAVLKRTGMTEADVLRTIAKATNDFIEGVLA